MFKNKRFLITQPAIRSINGSTVVSLELAKTLIELGAKVTVYTCDYQNPAKALFEKNNIKVDTSNTQPNYKLSEFDYVWIHSQILPISFLKQLTSKTLKKYPSFIFLHMSGMDWIPDEKPWIYDLENKLSSLSLFICEEVKSINAPYLDKKIPTAFFRNPAPAEFKNRTIKPSSKLKNLLIVSNHPPKEVLEAKQILTEKYHINTTIMGEGQEKYQLFDKKILEKNDAILTIAKTTQYCLISGTPVYIYDAFGGGPGWLNKQNFEKTKTRNFSGYQNSQHPNYIGGVFHTKTADEIASEIINGYNKSLEFHKNNQQKFFNDFAIDLVLPQIIQHSKHRAIKPLDKNYAEAVINSELFATEKFIIGGLLYDRDQEIIDLRKANKNLLKQNKNLLEFQEIANQVFQSGAYKLFNTAIKPYKRIKNRKK